MSVIMQQIKQCMSGLDKTVDGKTVVSFRFPENFIGFKGHFPTRAVLPGVCKIQAVIVIAQELHKKKAKLKKIILAKFFEPVSQDEELFFDYSESAWTDNEALLKASVSSNGKKIAKLELRISFT